MQMGYSLSIHLSLTVLGLVLLVVLVFTLRSEMNYLIHNRSQRLQFAFSILSIFVSFLLTLTCLFHWILSPFFTFVVVTVSSVLLFIFGSSVLLLRANAFKKLPKERIEEQRKLIYEVQDIIDEKKRRKIEEQKIKRGEKPRGE